MQSKIKEKQYICCFPSDDIPAIIKVCSYEDIKNFAINSSKSCVISSFPDETPVGIGVNKKWFPIH